MQIFKKRYSLKELKLIAAYISGDGSPESKLLQDADNLDEVGLINIWKMFTYSGLNKVSIKDTADYYFKAERQRQLKKIKSEINFPEAKKIGIERLQKTDEFLRALIDESKGL